MQFKNNTMAKLISILKAKGGPDSGNHTITPDQSPSVRLCCSKQGSGRTLPGSFRRSIYARRLPNAHQLDPVPHCSFPKNRLITAEAAHKFPYGDTGIGEHADYPHEGPTSVNVLN